MAMHDEIMQETKKMKDMTFKGKLKYLWDYYHIHFLVIIVLIVALTVLIRDMIRNSYPTYVYTIMANTAFSYGDTNTIEDDFIKEIGLDMKKNNLTIDMSMYLDNGVTGGTSATLASREKLAALIMARDLDVFIAPKEVADNIGNMEAYADMTKVLPQELYDEMIDREYEPYYYTIPLVDSYGEPTGSTGEPYVAGFYLDSCRYLNNQGQFGAYGAPTEDAKRPVFTIIVNSNRIDHAIDFLEFLIK